MDEAYNQADLIATFVAVCCQAVELNSAGSGARYSATIIPRTEVELAFKVAGYVDALQQVRGVDGRMLDRRRDMDDGADCRLRTR